MLDHLYMEWIRQASNVNTLFRKELADVFWTHTMIIIGDKNANTRQFVPFLEERPAIHKSIKVLEFDFNFESGAAPWTNEEEFEVWLTGLSALTLGHLYICFNIDGEEMTEFGTGGGRFSYLRQLSTLRVMKSFEVYCYIDTRKTFHDIDFNRYSDRVSYREDLWDKWKPEVLEWMMPDTLRQTLPQSEMEKYLSARLPLPIPSSPEST
jgi:hypothetical protein